MSWLARTPVLRSVFPPREHALRYRDREDRRALVGSRLLALATLLAGAAYLVWLSFTANRTHPVMATAFIAAEIVCLLLFLTATVTVWRLRFKPAATDRGAPWVPVPLAAARRRVARARQGWQPQLRAVTDQWRARVGARRRPGAAAERRERPGRLSAVSHVAFIQSRQFFSVPAGDPFFNLDRVFYEAVQLGYDHRDTALSCGSGVLYRRSALDENGGFSTWHVVEDLTTPYEMHSRGWRSFCYPHALSTRLAPAEIWGVYR